MEGTTTGEPKKDTAVKDGSTTWDSEASGLVYRGECCFSTCTYTSDHYHCHVCGINTSDFSQALAHTRASPSCRKDSIVHYSAPSVGMATDPTNSLYNAIYNGFAPQQTYPTPGFSGYSQIDSFQWHPTMPDKVAICSTQLSPCCSSNGGSYIPVDSQLCSPMSDLYSKVTGPIRDLVSLPAKSAGSAIDSQAWFAAYNPQPMQKNAYKYSEQNIPPQINFILLDSGDQKQLEVSEPTSSATSSFCGKSDKDVLKDSFCTFTQPVPGMLSEDAIFSLQLQDETLKQTDIHQTVPQILLSDLNGSSKSSSQTELTSTAREENHVTHEHFNHYNISSCAAYPPQDEAGNEGEETSNQPSSAASDSDESDIIVEDTGDDLGSQMTESEIFIEDIKCSLLQGVVNEDENHTPSIDVYQGKGSKTVNCVMKEVKSCRSSEDTKMHTEPQMKSCVSSYNSLLKCVICEKSASDGNTGSVFVEMNNQMPLTTSSQTPVLTKLNEVVAVEVTDFLDVNGKFMCHSCFTLVDTVDSLESKLESLKQNIAAMMKSGSKTALNHTYSKLPVSLVDKTQTSIISASSRVKSHTSGSVCVQEMFQNPLVDDPSPGKPIIGEDQKSCQANVDGVERKEYMLFSERAMSFANSINKVTLSFSQNCSTASMLDEANETETVIHQEDSQTVSDVHCISSDSCQIPAVQATFIEDNKESGGVALYQSSNNKQNCKQSPKRSKTEDLSFVSTRQKREFSQNLDRIEKSENLALPTILPNVQPLQEHASDNSKCKVNKCLGALRLEQKAAEVMTEKHHSECHTCGVCDESFTSSEILAAHISKYSNIDPSLCELCGKLHHSSKHLNDHMSQIHLVYCKNCESCGMRFSHPYMYEAHVQNRCEPPLQNLSSRYPCDKCNQTFHSQSYLENHLKEMHVPKKTISKCDQCERTFIKPSDLQAHKRSHSDVKNYECKVCGRKYKSLGNLNHHAKSHELTKPYSCEICSQGFIRKDFYETHINFHKDSKPFKCDKCQKGFVRKSSYQTHLKWHDDKLKKVTCPLCKKTFSQRLNVHMRSHTGERPHSCLKCPKKFITGSALRKHIKRFHNYTSTPENECSASDGSDPGLSESDEACSPVSCPE